MEKFRYVKSNAFTSGESLGNPAACIFTGQEDLTPEQMQAIAAEHKGFVMEVVLLPTTCWAKDFGKESQSP